MMKVVPNKDGLDRKHHTLKEERYGTGKDRGAAALPLSSPEGSSDETGLMKRMLHLLFLRKMPDGFLIEKGHIVGRRQDKERE